MPVKICLFDAYGTLFDVTAAARRASEEPGQEDLAAYWSAIAGQWRRKQLEYSWQLTIRNETCDFWQVTQAALDWVLEAEGLQDDHLRERLLALYWQLEAYQDVPATLSCLAQRGLRSAIVSNGSADMLANAVNAAGIRDQIATIISAETIGVFKPSPRIYDHACHTLGTTPEEIALITSNSWEACAAAAYGFRTIWLNRTTLPMEHLPGTPDHQLRDLSHLPELEIF